MKDNRNKLRQNQEFFLIKENLYFYLATIYGGGPAIIPREIYKAAILEN